MNTTLMMLKDIAVGKPAVRRNPKWEHLRDEEVRLHPYCSICGNTTKLNVHHKLPFHLFPMLELERSNLIVLCEKSPHNVNCHYVFGHLGLSWSHYNPTIDEDAKYLWKMFSGVIK